MKRFGIIQIGLIAMFALSGCKGAHAHFCEEAAAKLCTHCVTCGPDGYKKCGFLDVGSDAECHETLFNICEAYEPNYTQDAARACLSAIGTAPCDAPKPEACSRLF